MKILFSASVYRHLAAFHIPYMQYFLNNGHEVYAVAKDDGNKNVIENLGVKCIDIDIERSPFKLSNIKAYFQLKSILRINNFDLITTHTPFISFLIRLVNMNHTKLIYTAHGFHFYKGGSVVKNTLYKNMERFAAKFTDEIAVMNEEDYKSAQQFFNKENVHFINGIGVNLSEYNAVNIDNHTSIREELGLDSNDIIISYVAEMSKRKNQVYLLKNWKKITYKCPRAKLVLIGSGEMGEVYKEYVANHNLEGVIFAGYRQDIKEIIYQSDIVALLSTQEGLPRCVLEGMALHKPLIVSHIRGNTDLVQNGINGFTIELDNDEELIDKFITLIQNKNLRHNMGLNNEQIKERYSETTVLEQMKCIYDKVLSK